MQKRRPDPAPPLDAREKDLEAKYVELSEKLYSQYHSEQLVWQSQRLEVLNADRQTLRADFEKKEMLLSQKLDAELAKHRAESVRREEEFSARKDELEKNYYAELERGRAAIDKMRKEVETSLNTKLKEIDEEHNRLTTWVLKKEEEYIKKSEQKEQQLQHRLNESEAQLRERYERRIKELEEKPGKQQK